MTLTATATLTKQLIDSMIDQAHADNLLAGYVIIIGHAPPPAAHETTAPRHPFVKGGYRDDGMPVRATS